MTTDIDVWPGTAYPLGATFDGGGTNFALFSEVADRVELCLIDADGAEVRLDIPEVDAHVWHCYLPHVQPGQRYGYRVHGPFEPEQGLRCNPAKLLLDPYAKATDREIDWHPSVFGYDFEEGPESRNDEDSGPHMTLGVVTSPFFDWEGDRRLNVPYNESLIYEAHVKGLTQLHPDVPEELRGTYAGLAHPAITEHLTRLGVTAIELMPVHQFVQDNTLLEKGLRNYWGYNTLGFFAPHAGYSANPTNGQQVQEFKTMVKAMHQAGIEVILDVVYNHTAEGNHLGPTLSFKGIDNPAYYRLVEDDQQYYMDYTGTGNSLNVRHPHSLQLIMDSLRYWVTEMHVDGFRFDLAAALAREFYDVDRLATFFELVQQDPIVSQVKLIAEPWDVGPGGYQVGNFPPLWTEWNGAYRDTVRDFWRGEPSLGEFASRLAGSSDLYEHSGRRPFASINFVTAHDGFTLRDLVSYNEKHNDANGEDNNDGESHNRSWNRGVEGPDRGPRGTRGAGPGPAQLPRHAPAQPGRADDPARRRARPHPERQQQHLRPGLRDQLGALGPRRPAAGRVHRDDRQAAQGAPDVPPQALLHRQDGARRATASASTTSSGCTSTGRPMEASDWRGGRQRRSGCTSTATASPGSTRAASDIVDDHFVLYFNAAQEDAEVTLPPEEYAAAWDVVLDTSGAATESADAQARVDHHARGRGA